MRVVGEGVSSMSSPVLEKADHCNTGAGDSGVMLAVYDYFLCSKHCPYSAGRLGLSPVLPQTGKEKGLRSLLSSLPWSAIQRLRDHRGPQSPNCPHLLL